MTAAARQRYLVKEADGRQRIVGRRQTVESARALADRQPGPVWVIDRLTAGAGWCERRPAR